MQEAFQGDDNWIWIAEVDGPAAMEKVWDYVESLTPPAAAFNCPTAAPPGTIEKMAVLMWRVDFGLPLHHVGDHQDTAQT